MLNVISLSKGANTSLASGGNVTVELQWASASVLDVSCFMVNAEGKVPSDAYMIFYNQTTDPEQSVCLETSEANKTVFTMNLDAISPTIHKCFLTATLDGDETFHSVNGLGVTAKVPNGEVQYQVDDATDEKALVLVEIYRHQGSFKIRAIGRGFNGGLKPLAESFGVQVDEEEQSLVSSETEPLTPVEPTLPLLPASEPNAVSVDAIIAQLKRAGLEAEHPEELKASEFGDRRKEGKRIYVPNLGEGNGGRLFEFGTLADLQFAKHHYDHLSGIGFFSHTHARGLFLLQMNGAMKHDEFEKYTNAMNDLITVDHEEHEKAVYHNAEQAADIEQMIQDKIVDLLTENNVEKPPHGSNPTGQTNFCSSCGSQLVQNAKFCSNCGTPVAAPVPVAAAAVNQVELAPEMPVRSDTDTQAKAAAPSSSVTFQLLGRTLSFSEDMVEYNKLRRMFSTYASKSKTDFVAYYNTYVKSFDDLFDKAFPTFIESVIASLKFGVSVLMKYDVDDVDFDRLASFAAEDLDMQKYIAPFVEAAEKIEEYAESLSSYRELSRAGRSRWQGGGFGLGGAIKGALTAGVLNMGTGMVRGIGDSLTNAGDRAKIAGMKKDIFTDHRTLALLTEGVHECCFGVFFSVWQILEDEDRIPVIAFDTERLNARANNLVEHYASDKSLYNKAVDALCECIQHYPYSVSYYTNLYSIARDSRQEALKAAKYFGLESEYREAIVDLDRSRLANIKAMPDDTLEQIAAKRQKLNGLRQDNPDIDVNALQSSLGEKKNLLTRQMKQQASVAAGLEQVGAIRKPIDEAIRNGNLAYVWAQIDNGNVYAEYALEKHYKDTVCHNSIEKYNVSEMESLLSDVQKRANSGHIYAQYLIADMEYAMYGRDRRNSSKEKAAASVVIDMAAKGNISAIAMQGFWGSQGYNNATSNKSSAIALLEKAASRQQPTALAWLGSFYRSGEHGLSIDKEKAEMMLKLAATYGQPYGIKELDKLNSGSTSSSCFITTAVCRSLGRADDGYELTAFRAFRDNWLSEQADGERLIQEYYSVAPIIVNHIDAEADRETIYSRIWNDYLEACLRAIENGSYQRCKDIYCGMVNDLKLRYL
ncbi:stress protein [Paenibacillus curdlanolyticus YK9]|uniref:Stress protein n=1 Tax=Paenibacillus curdlanolyticus YK9 TaxID=717606 RepID=E0I9I5_9BACL|nr:TerD family protein [Paenibacillus curdlanolyticus]EFM11069.1 stress protein [Paenibacillus curdlanolyticus YK9]